MVTSRLVIVVHQCHLCAQLHRLLTGLKAAPVCPSFISDHRNQGCHFEGDPCCQGGAFYLSGVADFLIYSQPTIRLSTKKGQLCENWKIQTEAYSNPSNTCSNGLLGFGEKNTAKICLCGLQQK